MKFPMAVLLIASTTISVFPLLCERNPEGDAQTKAVARVVNTVITRQQLEEASSEQLEQLQTERLQFEANQLLKKHQILEKQLHELIDRELLNLEAEQRGLSREELLKVEVESKVPETTQEEVDKFYEANKARIRSSKEQATPRILQFLNQRKSQQAYQNFLNQLKDTYDVDYLLEPLSVEVETQGHPSVGPADAPVTIVEFSDFECPFCSRFVPTIRKVKENYSDKIRLVFRQFPLNNIHPQAQKAAEASLCAAEQGKFWEMHDLMFEDQKLSVADLGRKAESLGLDTTSFEECLDSGKYAEQVKQDISAGARAGVTGTPTIFINGRLLSGAVPYEQVTKIIDEELR